MPLKKRLGLRAGPQDATAKVESEDRREKEKSKRQRIVDFFRHRKHKQAGDGHAETIPVPYRKTNTAKPARKSDALESPKPAKSLKSNDSARSARAGVDPEEQSRLPSTPPSEPHPATEEVQPQQQPLLTEEQVHTLFSGAPQFFVDKAETRSIPRANFPWNDALVVKDVSDSVQLAHPAFSAVTLRRHLPVLHQSSEQDKQYLAFDTGVVELPSMLSAQGVEPGTIGFASFLELPTADALVTDLQQSQSSNGFLESVRNKEQMQKTPERLGIRRVDVAMIYDRLIEFGDLIEVFQDSPQRMTILNNQTSGDLYAHLFGKFLMPPGYDDSADDPTGMKVQIDTLLKILRLKGVWYDFSLVEWRIRLGQILWSDLNADPPDVAHPRPLWSERDILLLQITLSCELLLRLDAVTSMEAEDVKSQMHVSPDDFHGFIKLKSRKVDWDLILARRFLDNIVIMKKKNPEASAQSPPRRGLLSLLSREGPKTPEPEPEIVLVPRHQARQLSGLVCFAEAIKWPDLDMVIKELSQKLCMGESESESEPSALTTHRKFLDPDVSSFISVYGTPLATPRSGTSVRDSYFGNIGKPALQRNDSQLLNIPLSTALLSQSAGAATSTPNVGGWLSRSYLTGLILPGEAISHLLMSTLLENDRLAIAALGDSANLYGGFVYADRSWWSKNCVVGRVVACIEGAVECMGWISVPRVPDGLVDGWYAVHSEQLPHEQPPRIAAEEDLIFASSAFVPSRDATAVKPEELTLPLDPSTLPIPSVECTAWSLTPVNPTIKPVESDASSLSPSEQEPDIHTATLTFASSLRGGNTYTLALKHDVQFIASYPCTPPSTSLSASGVTAPEVLKPVATQPVSSQTVASASTQLSSSNSKRSVHTESNTQKGISRLSLRRNSHGFEPLLSHPPDSEDAAPVQRVYDENTTAGTAPSTLSAAAILSEDKDDVFAPSLPPPLNTDTNTNTASEMNVNGKTERLSTHPLHTSHKYKLVPVTAVLEPNFVLPFPLSASPSSSPRRRNSQGAEREEAVKERDNTILVIDARASDGTEESGGMQASRDLQLVARAWCADRGYHAIIARVGRTCLACCVREARGLGVRVVVRV